MVTDDPFLPVQADDVDAPLLRRFLFREASAVEGPHDVIRWWESRRLAYNAIVGATGVATLASTSLLAMIGPHPHPFFPPPIAIVVYGVLANLMFTGGWLAELALRPVFGRKTPVVGATIFRYGLAFSVGLTLLPNVVGIVDLGIRLLRWLLGA